LNEVNAINVAVRNEELKDLRAQPGFRSTIFDRNIALRPI